MNGITKKERKNVRFETCSIVTKILKGWQGPYKTAIRGTKNEPESCEKIKAFLGIFLKQLVVVTKHYQSVQ